jgi:beta-N-acetylhexosaminidase
MNVLVVENVPHGRPLMRTHFRALLLLAAALIATASLALAGCAPRVPDEDPSIRGEIVAVLPDDEYGSIAVEAPDPPEFEYDRAVVRITEDTTLLRQTTDGDTEVVALDALEVGLEVDVWFEGPVAESYPVQATAGLILVKQ